MASVAPAAAVDLSAQSPYASSEQISSIQQFSDVKPSDWAYQALANLIERYGCVVGFPDGSFAGQRSLTRYEAAAALNACLDRVSEITDELKKLTDEFAEELALIRARVDGLEARVGVLEATQFSTTTKLAGQATFVLGANSFGGTAAELVRQSQAAFGATTLNYDLQLTFDTSFTGKDLLRTNLRAGNFGVNSFGGAGPSSLSQLEVAFEENLGDPPARGGDVVAIDRLYYQFPIGGAFTATVGGRVGQEDMLAIWPSVYPAETVLDVL
ncbi:MAG: iron uptake porin, partial [Cyanobacteriota bacterium]